MNQVCKIPLPVNSTPILEKIIMRAGRDLPDLADESVFIRIQSIHKDCYPQSVNMFSF